MLERSTLLAAVLAISACSGNLNVGKDTTASSAGLGASSGGPSPSAGGSGSTGATGSSGGNVTANASGDPGSGVGSGASTGTGTGGATTGESFGPIDGGYVFCERPANPDAGADAGGVRWMCPPGTYICDMAHPGRCYQCLSDADCITPAVPTYTHPRPRCDLSSGVAGYQNFCQVCLSNADCATNQNGNVCDLNRADREPPIVNVGFETCTCLADAGKTCPVPDCDPATCPWAEGRCSSDLDCGNGRPYCVDGGCAQCRINADCTHLKGSGYCDSNHYCGDSVKLCGSDADCAGILYAPTCLNINGTDSCGCGSNDCAGSPLGARCDQRVTDTTYGNCGCQTAADCAPGQTCPAPTTKFASSTCQSTCDVNRCPPGYSCDPANVCRSHCDPGQVCTAQEPVCDIDDLGHRNFPGVTWCYECLSATDCDAGQACSNQLQCGPCNSAAPCPTGQTCAADLACHATCRDSDDCPTGQICDTFGLVGAGPLCYQCLTAGDCPGDQGCDSKTHLCGTCELGGDLDCRPGDVCSNYWPNPEVKLTTQGVCLHRCDLSPCPADMPLCLRVPPVSGADHVYCVGCLKDSDCADTGPGAWCDVTINFTFQCQPGDARGKPPTG